jgi:hypothetical protein
LFNPRHILLGQHERSVFRPIRRTL